MTYMLLVYSPESAWTREEWLACTVASGKICDELRAQGSFIAATPLQPVATAASVRVRGGETLVTAGPFAETVEQLGGFFLIDVPSLDEAIAVAARLPSAAKGTIEIRPVQALAGVPESRFAAPPPPDTARYLLLCYDDDAAWTTAGPTALSAAQAEAAAHTRDLASARADAWSPTARSPRPPNASAAITWSMCVTSTTPSPSPPSIRVRASARSRCAASSIWLRCKRAEIIPSQPKDHP